jgi:hypothetical protein
MNTWILNLKKIRLELEAQDPEMVISKRMYASKLMRGSGLNHGVRAQSLNNAGCMYDPERLSQALRTTHKDMQDRDDHKGKTDPMKLRVKKTCKTRKTYRSTNHQDDDDEMDDGDDDNDDDDVLVLDAVSNDEDEDSEDDGELNLTHDPDGCDVNEQDGH